MIDTTVWYTRYDYTWVAYRGSRQAIWEAFTEEELLGWLKANGIEGAVYRPFEIVVIR